MSQFDVIIPRRGTGSLKWELHPEDVLPLWVADADFKSPPAVLDALRDRVDHGIFGYQMDEPALRAALVDRLAARHQLSIGPRQIVFVPGLVAALNVFTRIFGEPGCGVMFNTPIYPPFISATRNGGKTIVDVPLAASQRDGHLYYEMDFDAMRAAVTPQTRLFILCNPHNPTGRAFTRPELEALAEFVLEHDLILCADEIHCDLILGDGAEHISIAALSPEIAARTITLMAPSKTFNVPGLGLGFAVITDSDLQRQYQHAIETSGLHPGTLGFTGALAAYTGGDTWLRELLAYLRGNRDYIAAFMRDYLPHIPITLPEATYLSWFDLRGLGLDVPPANWLIEHARIGLNDGAAFGDAGRGFVRLNFACPRATLTTALERLRAALAD